MCEVLAITCLIASDRKYPAVHASGSQVRRAHVLTSSNLPSSGGHLGGILTIVQRICSRLSASDHKWAAVHASDSQVHRAHTPNFSNLTSYGGIWMMIIIFQ